MNGQAIIMALDVLEPAAFAENPSDFNYSVFSGYTDPWFHNSMNDGHLFRRTDNAGTVTVLLCTEETENLSASHHGGWTSETITDENKDKIVYQYPFPFFNDYPSREIPDTYIAPFYSRNNSGTVAELNYRTYYQINLWGNYDANSPVTNNILFFIGRDLTERLVQADPDKTKFPAAQAAWNYKAYEGDTLQWCLPTYVDMLVMDQINDLYLHTHYHEVDVDYRVDREYFEKEYFRLLNESRLFRVPEGTDICYPSVMWSISGVPFVKNPENDTYGIFDYTFSDRLPIVPITYYDFEE